jgi:hypothetical protein
MDTATLIAEHNGVGATLQGSEYARSAPSTPSHDSQSADTNGIVPVIAPFRFAKKSIKNQW